ncbi:hypothetical protein [Streptomyces fungicidicus]|uniref:hypothetical protein n=1 Tax=Streptomyces fungicidicus TaxID=68203 RepID=UPI00367EC952
MDSIIPEGRSVLRRMPADGSGKTGFCQPGGYVALMAEGMEEHVLSVARKDADRALALVTQGKTSRYELIQVIAYLVQSSRAAVEVAELRQERLDALD